MNLKNLSELKVIWSPGDGYYIGRDYWNARTKRYEPWGAASLHYFTNKAMARAHLKLLIQRQKGVNLAEGTAVGVYMDLVEAGRYKEAVFTALTVEMNVHCFNVMEVA